MRLQWIAGHGSAVVIDVNARYLAELLYIVRAIWLGVTLRRTRAVAPVPAV
jgi:hypothetical protein